MYYYQRNLNTFDDVVKHYESVKPIISIHHDRADDIRPIEQRRRKWERVVKISDTCYALDSGTAFFHTSPQLPNNILRRVCSIVWERTPDGDYVHVRNVLHTHAVADYRFLATWLPRGMTFHIDSGKQFVNVHNTGENLFLPHPTFRPYVWHHLHNGETPNAYMVRNKHYARVDNTRLSFKVLGDGKFERVSKAYPHKQKRHYVNKSRKAKVADKLAAMRQYIETMSVMWPKPYAGSWNSLDYEERQAINKRYQMFLSAAYEQVGLTSYSWVTKYGDDYKAILNDPEDEKYHYFAVVLWRSTDGHTVENSDGLKSWRAKFNNHCNRTFGLTDVKMVTKDVNTTNQQENSNV